MGSWILFIFTGLISGPLLIPFLPGIFTKSFSHPAVIWKYDVTLKQATNFFELNLLLKENLNLLHKFIWYGFIQNSVVETFLLYRVPDGVHDMGGL